MTYGILGCLGWNDSGIILVVHTELILEQGHSLFPIVMFQKYWVYYKNETKMIKNGTFQTNVILLKLM